MQVFQGYIRALLEQRYLTLEQTQQAFRLIMEGSATPAQMGAFLAALRMKGETDEEMTGAAMAIRACMVKVRAPEKAMDVCGTGGDNLGTLNISTAVAFVLAACGVPVAKHGNKAVSSQSGSADVLSALGVNVEGDAALAAKSLREVGLCFMAAPRFHAAMRHVAPIRRELGVRTLFNLLGPLCNPAGTRYQLMGVYDKKWLVPVAKVLHSLGSHSAWVVHGEDGLDELTTTGLTYVAELKQGTIREFTLTPEEAGLKRATIEELQGGDAAYNAGRLEALLTGKKDAYRDAVLFNTAAALMVAGKVDNIINGIKSAEEAVDNKQAFNVLMRLKEATSHG